jgi:hypothetical protein
VKKKKMSDLVTKCLKQTNKKLVLGTNL